MNIFDACELVVILIRLLTIATKFLTAAKRQNNIGVSDNSNRQTHGHKHTQW